MDRQGSVGLFRQDDNGHWYAVTQLEPMDARRVVPCFDEPDRKATWKLTLTVPAHMRAFANMPVESERASDAGWREVTFQRSPPLPSYLLAFAVGEFEVVDAGRAGMNKTPVSIIVPKGRAAEAQYAAANTGAILAAAERFFGVPYPFPKLDLLAYPKAFFGTAMENPGLITYSARALLARPDEIGPVFEQRFQGITAHEISHMWFGDYVTMAWWNDLWLNESFASWLGSKLVLEMHPQWPGGWRSLQRTKAIDVDQLPAARALRQPITDARDVRAAFDGITYAKGETILAMFEQWLGPDKFRDGVRRYVAKHAWSNATADDFFAALAGSDDVIVPAFRAFADRPGVPLLDVALDCRAAPELQIAQQRFVPVGVAAAASESWTFPACFDVGDAQKSRQVCTVVRQAKQTIPLPRGACPQWVVANRSGTGYYLPRLSPALYDALPKADRVLTGGDYDPLLGDLAILARGGAVRYDVALRVAARQAKSPDTRVARRAYALADAVPAAMVDPREQGALCGVHPSRLRRPCAHPRMAAAEGRDRGRHAAAHRCGQAGRDPRRGHRTRAQGAAARAALDRAPERDPAGSSARRPGCGGAHVGQGCIQAVRRALRGRHDEQGRQRARGRLSRARRLRRLRTHGSGAAVRRLPRRTLAVCDRRARGSARPRRDPRARPRVAGAQQRRGDGEHPARAAGIHGGVGARCLHVARARAVRRGARGALANVDGGAARYKRALERIDQCIALRRAQQASFNASFAR
jgi:alanyl aminopeptidase